MRGSASDVDVETVAARVAMLANLIDGALRAKP